MDLSTNLEKRVQFRHLIVGYIFEFKAPQPFIELFEGENERGFVSLELQIVAKQMKQLR